MPKTDSLADMMSLFTAPFTKREDSNAGFLMSLFADEFDEANEVIERIQEWRTIDNAEGAALDDIGHEVDVYRVGPGDEFYRFLIKSQRALSYADGTVNNILQVLCDSLGCRPDEPEIVNLRDEGGPDNTIQIRNIPIDYIDVHDPSRVKLMMSRLQQAVAGGITLEGVYFQDKTKGAIEVSTILQSYQFIPIKEDDYGRI